MNARVLDTSVAVAWYLPETFSIEARRWRSQMVDGRVRFIVPTLHYWEIANVLRTYVRRGELEEDLAREIYETHLDAPLEVVDPAKGDVLDVALAYQATAYDAVYIALSVEQQIPLITAERTTAPWIVKMGKLAEIVRRGAG